VKPEKPMQATALAGLAVGATITISLIVEIARGRSGSPYDWLRSDRGPDVLGRDHRLPDPWLRWRPRLNGLSRADAAGDEGC
jgi:hypothetical protein